jgi:hypothetical protein
MIIKTGKANAVQSVHHKRLFAPAPKIIGEVIANKKEGIKEMSRIMLSVSVNVFIRSWGEWLKIALGMGN